MDFGWLADFGTFLWSNWGATGLLIGIPFTLVIWRVFYDTISNPKRIDTIFQAYQNRLELLEKDVASINNALAEEKEAHKMAERRNLEYRAIINSYTIIIRHMLGAIRMMQRTRRITNSAELDKEIDILLSSVQNDLKKHELMDASENLLEKQGDLLDDD